MDLLCLLLVAYRYVLIIYVVLSWVPRPPEPILPLVRGVRAIVDPLLRPLRDIIPGVPIGGVRLDLSIIVLFLATSILAGVVC